VAKSSNPFSVSKVQIVQKDFRSKTAVKWEGSFLAIADSTTVLSSKADTLTFDTGSARSGSSPNDDAGLLLAGESDPIVQYSKLDLGKGNDKIVNKAKGGVPAGSTGAQIFLRYNGTELNLGEGNDSVDTDIIRLRDGDLIGGGGGDSVSATQYIDVEAWWIPKPQDHAILDLGAGNDSIATTVLQVGGRVFMGDGRDTITGLIDDHWSSFDSAVTYASIDLGTGDDLINLRYGQTTHYNRKEGMSDPLANSSSKPEYVEINGGDGFDKILVSGGIFENIEAGGTALMKYSANGFNFYYKLTGIEEVAYG
jgi:hypothetical protein